MKTLLKPTVITDGGPWADHDMPCAICISNPAVFNLHNATFEPCWECQKQGWMLKKLKRWQRWFLILVFLFLASPAWAQLNPQVIRGTTGTPIITEGPRQGQLYEVGPSGALVPVASACHIESYFSPHGGATDRVVQEIENAKQTILVAMYAFTSSRITDALIAAQNRGVKIDMIFDQGQAIGNTEKAQLNKLKKAGMPYRISALSRTLHSKYAVIDGTRLLTGSFNWSNLAEVSNAENMLVISGCDLPKKYAENWGKLK